jgi:hypothetical protein
MRRHRHFKVELALQDADGQPSDLARDLGTDRSNRLRRLEGLTDDFLDEAQNMTWPRGREGSWIYFPLADDIMICQWNPGEKGLWALGYKEACLKIVRIVPRADLPGFLASTDEPIEND